MEEELKIPIGAKKYIYGTLRGSLANPLIIFVHGFTGHKDDHLFFNGARFFEKHGFSTFRFNLYHWTKDSRKLEDCTLSLHGKDLDTVVKYFRNKGVNKILVIGHSFGGLTILLSKAKDFEAAVLWDPATDPAEVTKAKYIKELDRYYVTEEGYYGFTISKVMYEENKRLKPFELIKKFKVPVKIIVAGKGILVKGGKKYFQMTNKPKAFAIVPRAIHSFNEDDTEQQLFNETLKFLKDY